MGYRRRIHGGRVTVAEVPGILHRVIFGIGARHHGAGKGNGSARGKTAAVRAAGISNRIHCRRRTQT